MNKINNFSEYCGKRCACFKPDTPKCLPEAVIPTLTVENKDGLKGLTNCLVHVSNVNTTYYIDDKGRITHTWSGPLVVNDYDYEENPLRLRNQMIYDFANGLIVVYNARGEYQVFNNGEQHIRDIVETVLREHDLI